MPEPVSTVGLCFLGYAALNAWVRGGNATSPEANAVRNAAYALVERVETSQALFGKKAKAISHLLALADEYAKAGQDYTGACEITSVAILKATEFVRALPDGLPLPEFDIEPDGAVSLDWIQSKTRLFSLSVGTSDRLAYAWLDGADKGHAVARFDGATIPPRILEGIKAIINHGNAPLRTT